MTATELYRALVKQLRETVGEDAESEARWMLQALGISRWDPSIPEDRLVTLWDRVRRRQGGEPLQYVLGEWEFYGMPFSVDRRVLIPRADTEVLVEQARKLGLNEKHRILDLCTGSGCIGIVLHKLTGATTVLSDISADALCVARENARKNSAAVTICEGDLFERIEGRFDLITVNPPYLTQEEWECSDPSLKFEPQTALVGGADGLQFYRRIAAEYRDYMNTNGTLLLEIGWSQAEDICRLFPGARIVSDYGGRPRVAVVTTT